MSKNRRRPKDTVRDALRASFAIPETLVLTQPLVHINCNGWIEIENCGGISEYGVQKIVFRLGRRGVAVMGEDLMIVSLNAHITEIRGRIFRVDLLEEGE